MELFLQDAVRTENLDIIRKFTSEVQKFAKQLMREAVQVTSCTMLELLLEICPGIDFLTSGEVIRWAMVAKNPEAIRILLSRGFTLYSAVSDKCFLAYISYTVTEGVPDLLGFFSRQESAMSFVIPKKSSPENDASSIKYFEILANRADHKAASQNLGACFLVNARLCCSITIAKYLFQRGVPLNFPKKTSPLQRGRLSILSSTALYLASRRKDQPAAELMKFLLESGVDPEQAPPLKSKTLVSNRPGPVNISKWLGISWEQLVEESRKVYAASQRTTASREELEDGS